MVDVNGLKFDSEFSAQFLSPIFAAGVLTPYPGAEFYAICYAELCAYNGERLLATWTADMPDCEADVGSTNPGNYAGKWVRFA